MAWPAGATSDDEKAAVVWDVPTLERRYAVNRPPARVFNGVDAFVFTADGKTLYTGSDDGYLRYRDAHTGELGFAMPAHHQPLAPSLFRPTKPPLPRREVTIRR